MANAPAPGEAPLPAANAAALLRANAEPGAHADRTFVRFGDRRWTHAEFLAESCRWANLLLERLPAGRPAHVGVLLDNTPDYLFAFGGAALVGATVVGLNHTRQGDHLARDAEHTHVGLLVTEPRHLARVSPVAERLGLAGERLLVSRRFADDGDEGAPDGGHDLADALARVSAADPGHDPSVDTPWGLIFTSGTTSAPKAVICSQRRLLVTGTRMSILLGLAPDDVGYVAMPLFHSNALMVGWAPALVTGASVGLARRFSASGWLPDVRRYGATWFNYTGKPLAYLLATPEQPDDADNPLRVAFGNEGSPEVVSGFARRFGLEVIDSFGATEGGIAVNREDGMPPGAMGRAPENVRVVDEDGRDRPLARFDEHGRLVNADE
ncbi:MAG: AMP-binding protein, partial [Acidimicrobiales bacterium]|nr:AMP-binding protein [Acidimicrobiales bacterium]